ncbi:hypothetical protein CYY_004445 [Polysphondylium violaceum]|uniref:RRM domain-containing protein n=1 Tax=Polysphondylium violaceum TaxID=133409 RepID=A0A8J4UZ83_9MYCE|nr:hypothetical protein CYY_004445 [Polysphondylium violaceum]
MSIVNKTAKASQKKVVAKSKKVEKTKSEPIKPQSLKDGFSNSHDVVPLHGDEKLKQKTEEQLAKEKRIIFGKEGSIIKILRLPHGFYEYELFKFFSQFGSIEGVKVDRTKNLKRATRAFVRFGDAEVAQIAKDAMAGYIMFGKRINVSISDFKPPVNTLYTRDNVVKAFKDNKKKMMEADEKIENEIKRYNSMDKSQTDSDVIKMLNDRLEREQLVKEKIKDYGLNYTFTGYSDIIKESLNPKPTTPITTPTTTTTKKSTTSEKKSTTTPVTTTAAPTTVKKLPPNQLLLLKLLNLNKFI